jgi:hypothetical protein
VKVAVLTVVVLGALAGTAAAYPQFQLSRDQTCTGCHISPAGGTLLNENGLSTAETISQFGTSPEFFYGAIPQPKWLSLGGDLRGAGGQFVTPDSFLYAFPMQVELYAHAAVSSVSLHVTGGLRKAPQNGSGGVEDYLWSREHYLTWQQKPGEGSGLYVRAGRFMPVFGLRIAEHPTYIRRFGGTPLYAEAYGVAVEMVEPKYEVHATGFVADSLNGSENDSGGAVYGELRTSETMAVGLEGMFTDSPDDKKFRVGATGKIYVSAADLLLQGELQFVNQLVDARDGGAAVGAPKGLVGYLLASRMIGDSFLIDLGLGHYDENLRIKNLDRDCVDLNVHWFATSHFELILNSRYEMLAFGAGGDSGAYAMLQGHYRL